MQNVYLFLFFVLKLHVKSFILRDAILGIASVDCCEINNTCKLNLNWNSAVCCRPYTILSASTARHLNAWWYLHAAVSSHIASLGFSTKMDSCGHLNPVLDVTLLCFRDRLVPAMREVGKLWVFYCLIQCQMFPWLHDIWSGDSEFLIKCSHWSEEPLQGAMLVENDFLLCVFSFPSWLVCSVLLHVLLAHRDWLGYQGWR